VDDLLNNMVKICEAERKFFLSLTMGPLVIREGAFTKEEIDLMKEERNKPSKEVMIPVKYEDVLDEILEKTIRCHEGKVLDFRLIDHIILEILHEACDE